LNYGSNDDEVTLKVLISSILRKIKDDPYSYHLFL